MAVRTNADGSQEPNITNEGLGNDTAPSFEAPFKNTARGTNGEKVLTFSNSRLSLMQAGQGSEYTDGIAKTLQAIYDNSQRPVKPVIHVLDKDALKLAYSTIIISLKLENKNTIPYFVILLEATGRKSMTASDIVNEYNTFMKMPNAHHNIYTADDAIDDVLNDHIKRVLTQQYGSGQLIAVDGVVLNANHTKFENFSHMLATIAYNACYTETALDEGQTVDLNIEAAMVESKNKRLKFISNMDKTVVSFRNELDAPVRADWHISLKSVDISNNITSLNLQNTEQEITRVAGFVDAIPEETQINDNGILKNEIRFRPHIVITSNSSVYPTIGFTLLGLLSANLMVKPSMWLGAVRPVNKTNVGALNLMAKLDKGVGERIDLSNKKYDSAEVWAVINQMFSLSPVISMDVESFGPQSYYTSVFSLAANSKNPDLQRRAAQHIINTAHLLTSGRFPSEFSPHAIFAYDGVTIPLGTYTNNHGDHDIRDIDLTYLASKTDDPAILNSWAISNLPASASGINPFITKVEIINKIVPNAEINGKGTRVTFTNEFISTLERCAAEAGLKANFEPQVKLAVDQNLSIMSSLYGAAGLQTQAGFAHEYFQAGPTFVTPYSNVGSYRSFS